eukprot:605537-Ditylum_brightwellii.AAC.1
MDVQDHPAGGILQDNIWVCDTLWRKTGGSPIGLIGVFSHLHQAEQKCQVLEHIVVVWNILGHQIDGVNVPVVWGEDVGTCVMPL